MKRQFPLVRLCSVIVFYVALMAIIGHLNDKAILYTWMKGHPGMGMPTAFCFMVTSWSLFILGLERSHHAKEKDAENRAE